MVASSEKINLPLCDTAASPADLRKAAISLEEDFSRSSGDLFSVEVISLSFIACTIYEIGCSAGLIFPCRTANMMMTQL